MYSIHLPYPGNQTQIKGEIKAWPAGSTPSNSCTDKGPWAPPSRTAPLDLSTGNIGGRRWAGASWPRSQASVASPVVSVSALPTCPEAAPDDAPHLFSTSYTSERLETLGKFRSCRHGKQTRGKERFVLRFIICFRCCQMVTEVTRKKC